MQQLEIFKSWEHLNALNNVRNYMYYLKHCCQFVWNIQHKVSVEWQIYITLGFASCYICHKTLTKCCTPTQNTINVHMWPSMKKLYSFYYNYKLMHHPNTVIRRITRYAHDRVCFFRWLCLGCVEFWEVDTDALGDLEYSKCSRISLRC